MTRGVPRTAPSLATDRDGVSGGRTTILVVEDEESYQEALLVGLSREGYHVQLASDGVEALRRFAESRPDLVVLDILLPTMSGIEVCRRMLSIAPVPIIIVSALDTEADIVRGLELGAEDYIAKPYRLRELVARIRSVLRRVSPSEQPATIPSRTETTRTDVLTVGPFQVNFARRVVTANGEPIHLSRREFDLLVLLLSPPGQVRSPRGSDRQIVVGPRPLQHADTRHAYQEASDQAGTRSWETPIPGHGTGSGIPVRVLDTHVRDRELRPFTNGGVLV